jgi:hypothetical protein
MIKINQGLKNSAKTTVKEKINAAVKFRDGSAPQCQTACYGQFLFLLYPNAGLFFYAGIIQFI